MTEQTERRRAERRQADLQTDDDLSPEYLALLEVCGGEIRASDRTVLAERRQLAQAEAEAARAEVKKAEAARAALAPSDRRRARAT